MKQSWSLILLTLALCACEQQAPKPALTTSQNQPPKQSHSTQSQATAPRKQASVKTDVSPETSVTPQGESTNKPRALAFHSPKKVVHRKYTVETRTTRGRSGTIRAKQTMILSERPFQDGGVTIQSRLEGADPEKAKDLPRSKLSLNIDKNGQIVSANDAKLMAMLQNLQLSRQEGKTIRQRLADGTYLEVTVEPGSSVRKKMIQGRLCQGSKIRTKLKGKTPSGESFRGQFKGLLWQVSDSKELLGFNGRQELRFRYRQPLVLSFSIVQDGFEGFVKTDQAQQKSTQRGQNLPPLDLSWDLAMRALLLLLMGLGGLVLFWSSRRLTRQQKVCVALALVMFCLPLVQSAEGNWLSDRFRDVTKDEIGWTVVGALVGGVAAFGAAVTAPVWAPIAVGAVTVGAIGTYWAMRTPPIRRGKVVAKRYEPAETNVILMPVITTVSNGKSTTTITNFVPMVVYDDADWVVTIEGVNERNDKQERREIYVDPNEYNRINNGEVFDMDQRGGSFNDENPSRKATAEEQALLNEAQSQGRDSVTIEADPGQDASSKGAAEAIRQISGN